VKHNLKFRGRPYSAEGEPLAPEDVSAGPGHARCSCGELSPELPSGGKRRAWHKQHVAEIEAARTPRIDDVPLSGDVWAIPGEHGPTVEVLASREPEAADPLVVPDPERDGLSSFSIYTLPMPPASVIVRSRRPGPGRHPFNPFTAHEGAEAVTFVPYPTTLAAESWPTFGMDASGWVGSVYVGVTVVTHSSMASATLSGEDPRAVREAALSIARMFDDASSALRHYTATDPEYAALPKGAYKRAEKLRIAFLRRYARRYAEGLMEGSE